MGLVLSCDGALPRMQPVELFLQGWLTAIPRGWPGLSRPGDAVVRGFSCAFRN